MRKLAFGAVRVVVRPGPSGTGLYWWLAAAGVGVLVVVGGVVVGRRIRR